MVAALDAAFDAVRTGTLSVAIGAPSQRNVWVLFAGTAVITLAVLYGLIAHWGLARWTLWLAIALLGIGTGVLAMTGRVEKRRRSGGTPSGLARWFTWRHAAFGGGFAAAAWVVVALLLIFKGPVSAGAANGGLKRLAVLPFENQGSADEAYFTDGIADQVRGKLTALAGLQITARSSSMPYRATTMSRNSCSATPAWPGRPPSRDSRRTRRTAT